MKIVTESKIVNEAVKMRQSLTQSDFSINELMYLFMATPVSDYFKHDASLGGYVPHKRSLRKRNYFI